MNIIKTILLSLVATGSFIGASEVGRYTGGAGQGSGAAAALVKTTSNMLYYGAKLTEFAAAKVAFPVGTAVLKTAEAITSNPYTFALAGLTAAYGGWRYHRWKEFNKVAEDARRLASMPHVDRRGHMSRYGNDVMLAKAIDKIRPYADGADEIDGSIGINYVLPEYDPKTKYAPKTNIITDIYRSFRPAEHVMRKKAWEIARPLVWVTSREASALLVQLREFQRELELYRRANPQAHQQNGGNTVVINNNIIQHAR